LWTDFDRDPGADGDLRLEDIESPSPEAGEIKMQQYSFVPFFHTVPSVPRQLSTV